MKKFILFFYLLASLMLYGYREGEPDGFSKKLSDAALERVNFHIIYDGRYRTIDYPGGDVPSGTGVCTDVIVRSYRKLGIDLQKDVHVDMEGNFNKYPQNWGLNGPDTNIDHRRVPNLRVFFKRKGISLKVTESAEDYLPGDIVTWMLDSGLPHIGIVVNRLSADKKRYLIVHNIGEGPELEDVLFSYNITGHYRYYGSLAD